MANKEEGPPKAIPPIDSKAVPIVTAPAPPIKPTMDGNESSLPIPSTHGSSPSPARSAPAFRRQRRQKFRRPERSILLQLKFKQGNLVLPSGWIEAPADISLPIGNTKLIVSKTPIGRGQSSYLKIPFSELWTPDMLTSRMKTQKMQIGLWIDLSSNNLFFNPAEVIGTECICIAGIKPNDPRSTRSKVGVFVDIVKKEIQIRPSKHILVTSDLGKNMCGFMICAYLCTVQNVPVDVALGWFKEANPPGIDDEKWHNHLHTLFPKTTSNRPLAKRSSLYGNQSKSGSTRPKHGRLTKKKQKRTLSEMESTDTPPNVNANAKPRLIPFHVPPAKRVSLPPIAGMKSMIGNTIPFGMPIFVPIGPPKLLPPFSLGSINFNRILLGLPLFLLMAQPNLQMPLGIPPPLPFGELKTPLSIEYPCWQTVGRHEWWYVMKKTHSLAKRNKRTLKFIARPFDNSLTTGDDAVEKAKTDRYQLSRSLSTGYMYWLVILDGEGCYLVDPAMYGEGLFRDIYKIPGLKSNCNCRKHGNFLDHGLLSGELKRHVDENGNFHLSFVIGDALWYREKWLGNRSYFVRLKQALSITERFIHCHAKSTCPLHFEWKRY